jgi:hypothetical protein
MVSNDGSSSYVPEHKTRDRQLQALASRNDISAPFVLGDGLGAPCSQSHGYGILLCRVPQNKGCWKDMLRDAERWIILCHLRGAGRRSFL